MLHDINDNNNEKKLSWAGGKEYYAKTEMSVSDPMLKQEKQKYTKKCTCKSLRTDKITWNIQDPRQLR